MIELFCGYDPREYEGWETFVSSVRRRTAADVHYRICHDIQQRGSNTFTISRFEIADEMQFTGRAIFCDASDQVMLRDVAELDALFDDRYAVQVVKHNKYKTRHPWKYLFTEMECPNQDYDRKNWASVMLINCGHEAWRPMTKKHVQEVSTRDKLHLLQFKFIPDEAIGELPPEWNRLVDEGQETDGAILHWTAGIPLFPHYRNAPAADIWRREYEARK